MGVRTPRHSEVGRNVTTSMRDMFYVGHSTPGEKSWGLTVDDGKAYGQFTGSVKLIIELHCIT